MQCACIAIVVCVVFVCSLDYVVDTALPLGEVDGLIKALSDTGVQLSPEEKGVFLQTLVTANCIDTAVKFCM